MTDSTQTDLAATQWISDATLDIVLEEIHAGGWFTVGDPSTVDPGVRRHGVAHTVDDQVRGLFGTMAQSLGRVADGPDVYVLDGTVAADGAEASFNDLMGRAVIARLPMARERAERFLAALHADVVVAAQSGALTRRWYGVSVLASGELALVIDRAKRPAKRPIVEPRETGWVRAKAVQLFGKKTPDEAP